MIEQAVKEMETFVVGADEVLVIRVGADMLEPDLWGHEEGNLERLQKMLSEGPLRDRFVVFVGEVEFAKVKK